MIDVDARSSESVKSHVPSEAQTLALLTPSQCDIQRPCTLCVHAGTECETGPQDQFRAFQAPIQEPPRKRSRRSNDLTQDREPEDGGNAEQAWSSSTMSLVAGVSLQTLKK